jgi:HSP20 family protein
MDRLRRQMNRLFAGLPTIAEDVAALSYPAINVWTNENDAVVTAEVPGVDPKDLDVSIEGDTLTLTGSRHEDELPEGTVVHRRERGHGKFSRIFRLPFPVEPKKVEARFENGVLHINLPRLESDKPKKIAIKTA